MGKKATKATKKFVASGQLKKTIEARRKKQQIAKKFAARRGNKGGKGKDRADDRDDEEDEAEEQVAPSTKKSQKRMTVDSFLSGDFMDQSDDDGLGDEDQDVGMGGGNDSEDDDFEGGEGESDDDGSFASVDDLDEDGENHMLELSKLAEKDPEFYKYLQENDKELLEFNPDAIPDDSSDEEGEDEDVDMEEEEKTPVLTKEQIKKWQKSLLEQRSLRALRKLLIAFRSAAHLNEDGRVLAWAIDSSSVYNKLVTTTLRYTPVVLEHHVPYKTLANGKFKPPTQTPKFKTLQKLILSHFHNATYILSQLTDEETLRLALTESAKLVPYIISSRKSVKAYLKKCLELWSNGADSIRIAAFLSVRRLAASSDESIIDNIMKSTYLTLLRSSKSTSAFTLPSINLMKNSASEVFCLDHATAYQHAFGYIRQLAIHLRNSMKIKSKEAFKQVYNWQFAHCVDFWSIVLARACDVHSEEANGKQSELRPLIYPLVQVCLGAIKLVPNSRSHPFHLQIIRSLLHLTKHTQTYIPLSSYLVPIIASCLTPSTRPKASTLRPLDLEVQIRVPQQYVKTRVLLEGISEESVFLLAEWLASAPVHGSVAFPEIVVPILVLLRKSLKTGKNSKTGSAGGKEQTLVKVFLERLEESSKWMEEKRKTVHFAPSRLGDVQEWERAIKPKLESDTPLGKYLKVQRKTREKRRKLVEKARHGEDEILEED
ncbi:putative NOC2 family protein [Psilocybe cubensis]|uniref:NOC2 family protein n=2 Tax=Psilocybe cubensis TaxID=181762 RepID=A0ACB8GML6_PSICU|nr:putative NOC2 family protein [Psilocybe cubensis]KAH9476916.1 putative NOC2 family protein [Psilocybe cubensis]